MSKDAKVLVDTAGDFYADVAASLKTLTKHLQEDAGDALSKSTRALVQSAAELAEEAQKKSKDALKKVGEEVREHPAATAAIAAAAVALIGLAIAQRRAHE